MTPSREAIEAAARALCPMPFDGERKNQCWEDYAAEAEAALTAALPLLAEVNAERDSASALLRNLQAQDETIKAEQARWQKKFDTQVIKDGNELLAKDETIKALVEALENIARQKTDAELGDDGPFGSNYDFAEGYDCCVMRARAAIALVRKGA